MIEGNKRVVLQRELWDHRARKQGPKTVMCSDFSAQEAFEADKVQSEILDHMLGGKTSNLCLELGAGYGRLTDLFLRHSQGVVLMDISHRMLSNAKDLGFSPVVQADLMQQPFSSEVFDLITAASILGHISSESELERVVKEIGRLSMMGSRLVVDEMEGETGIKVGGGHYTIRSSEYMKDLFAKNWDLKTAVSYMFGPQQHTAMLFSKIS